MPHVLSILEFAHSLQVQSAVFGLSAFRPTQAAISGSGVASIAGSLDSVAWLTSNPALHPQIAQAYQLPGKLRIRSELFAFRSTRNVGCAHRRSTKCSTSLAFCSCKVVPKVRWMPAGAVGNFSNTELLQIVVASEVFQLFGETGEHLKRVALTASRRWAGPEMTANGFLITYLRKAVPSRSHFLASPFDDEIAHNWAGTFLVLRPKSSSGLGLVQNSTPGSKRRKSKWVA